MKSKKNLVFIGMMGSGKSSIGSMVSKKLNLNFFDIDQLIENDQKMKISKIFEIKGENSFRDIEKKITLNILKSKKDKQVKKVISSIIKNIIFKKLQA